MGSRGACKLELRTGTQEAAKLPTQGLLVRTQASLCEPVLCPLFRCVCAHIHVSTRMWHVEARGWHQIS